MNRNGALTTRNVLPAVAAILVAAGLGIDLGYTQPRVREVRRLKGVQLETLNQLAQSAAQSRERKYLAKLLDRMSLPDTLSTVDEDPIEYLGHALDRAGLVQGELSTGAVLGAGSLHRARHSLQVRGGYSEILRFVRDLEMGRRLVTVEAISIVPPLDPGPLEARIDVSTYTVASR